MECPRYSMVIQWSEEDAAYLVTLLEWEGRVFNPVTHGDTYEEAVRNGASRSKTWSPWPRSTENLCPCPVSSMSLPDWRAFRAGDRRAWCPTTT